VYANSPYELESEAVIPELVKKSKYFQSLEQGVNALRATNNRPGANVASLKGGMNFLIDTLINQIDQKRFNLLPNKRVTAIEKSKDFWNVVTHDGEAFQAKNLIICCPLNIAASFFNEVQISNELKKFNTQSVTIVLALVNSIKLNNTPIGTGALKAYDLTGNSAKATTHVSAKWQWIKDSLPPNHHIVRFSFGYQGLTVSQTIGKVEIASALKNFYKIELDEFEIIDFKQIYWPNGLSQLSSGHRENLSALEDLEHIFPGLIFAGSGASGSGITALVKKASLRIEKLLL
jgi:protoporphyrinogen/coproporphyrinogen III oxidase